MPDPSKYKDDGPYPKGTKLYSAWIDKDSGTVKSGYIIYLGRNHSWHLAQGKDGKLFCMMESDLNNEHRETMYGAFERAIDNETNHLYRELVRTDKKLTYSERWDKWEECLRSQGLFFSEAIRRAAKTAVRKHQKNLNSPKNIPFKLPQKRHAMLLRCANA